LPFVWAALYIILESTTFSKIQVEKLANSLLRRIYSSKIFCTEHTLIEFGRKATFIPQILGRFIKSKQGRSGAGGSISSREYYFVARWALIARNFANPSLQRRGKRASILSSESIKVKKARRLQKQPLLRLISQSH